MFSLPRINSSPFLLKIKNITKKETQFQREQQQKQNHSDDWWGKKWRKRFRALIYRNKWIFLYFCSMKRKKLLLEGNCYRLTTNQKYRMTFYFLGTDIFLVFSRIASLSIIIFVIFYDFVVLNWCRLTQIWVHCRFRCGYWIFQ